MTKNIGARRCWRTVQTAIILASQFAAASLTAASANVITLPPETGFTVPIVPPCPPPPPTRECQLPYYVPPAAVIIADHPLFLPEYGFSELSGPGPWPFGFADRAAPVMISYTGGGALTQVGAIGNPGPGQFAVGFGWGQANPPIPGFRFNDADRGASINIEYGPNPSPGYPIEVHTVPSSPPYQFASNRTPAPSGGGYFGDSGSAEVYYASSGLDLMLVPSNPSRGQYSWSIANGLYSFAAADAGTQVVIRYVASP